VNPSISIVVACNDRSVLKENLYRSVLALSGSIEIDMREGYPSASLAYNEGLSNTTAEFIVFAHQDVYLPKNWGPCLLDEIEKIEAEDKNWAVLGIVGVSLSNIIVGKSWSTGLGREVGKIIKRPQSTTSIDELVIIMRRESGLLFDINLPGYHLYGTDIIQTAISRGYGSYVINNPVIHNSLPIIRLGKDFRASYKYMQKKWHKNLPIVTPVTKITQFGWHLEKQQLKNLLKSLKKRHSYFRLENVEGKARELGYE